MHVRVCMFISFLIYSQTANDLNDNNIDELWVKKCVQFKSGLYSDFEQTDFY
jgi:hypothetical protein